MAFPFLAIAEGNTNSALDSVDINSITETINSLSTASIPKLIMILSTLLIYACFLIIVFLHKKMSKDDADEKSKAATTAAQKDTLLQTTKGIAKSYYAAIASMYASDVDFFQKKLDANDLSGIFAKVDTNLYDAYYAAHTVEAPTTPYLDIVAISKMEGMTNQEKATMICKLTKEKKPLSVLIGT